MTDDAISNKTYDEIRLGDSAQLARTLSERDIDLFAALSGDLNPTHLDERFALCNGQGPVTGYSLWSGTLISNLLGNELPGAGTLYKAQSLRFHHPVVVGDTVTVTIEATEKRDTDHSVLFDCRCVNQHNDLVASGTAEVIAPIKKTTRPRSGLPDVMVKTGDDFAKLMTQCKSLEPIITAVVHPCDRVSLTGDVEAAEADLIVPILVGPKKKIHCVADEFGLDIGGYRIVDTEHSHAAASKAVELIRKCEAELLMKGSLHTDEFLSAIVSSSHGIRTERRISHVFVMDVPTYPKILLITDAAVNIFPDLAAKIDICQNAIELAHTLGIETPKVAILSAVETVNPKIPSTLEASALCKMADRGQITGGLLDGPLAFDNAISKQAAKTKHIVSAVAGDADILLVPDLEAGNILAKQLAFLNHADGAGIVLGARVPIILTSRADNVRTRLASCGVAVLHAHALRLRPVS